MNIQEFIAAIRTWQAAAAEYEAARNESPDKGTRKRQAKMLALDAAAGAVTTCEHDRVTLASFVTLADEIERLRAERQRLKQSFKEKRMGGAAHHYTAGYNNALEDVLAEMEDDDADD